MKKQIILLTLILFSQTLIAQNCNDITPEAKNIIYRIGTDSYWSKVVGCCIDTNNNIHLTLRYGDYAFTALEGLGFNNVQIYHLLNLSPFFYSVKPFFKKFKYANSLNIYFVKFEKQRDKYGNPQGTAKIIMDYISMGKETANKLNEDYIREEFKKDILLTNGSNFIKLLDKYSGKNVLR